MKKCDCGFTEFQVVIEEDTVKIYCVQCQAVYYHNARYIWQDGEITELRNTED
jgi:hypothetical protein